MRIPCIGLAVAALILQTPPREGQQWWHHIEFLADDALQGRNVGTPGFEKAAEYVEQQFKEIGLKPAGSSGYRQPVKLESRRLVPEESSIALVRDGQEQPLTMREDAMLSARGELDGSIDAPMVFVGYGLSIPEAKWDDLAGQDLHGKIAVYVTSAAPVKIPDNVRSHLSSTAERWAVLRKAGAIGVATISNFGAILTSRAASPAAAATAPRPSADGRAGPPVVQPTVVLADRDLQDQAGQLVSMTLTAAGAEKLLQGSGHSVEELASLVRDRKPLPRFSLTGTLRVHAALERQSLDSENIVGMVEGSAPSLKSEYVVMSAHLDHLGVGRSINGDAIYNGAMDDASGVASVIEIARALKASGVRTKRSIVFMTVTGEEKGELGSKYFAAHPTVPFDAIVADINLDMFLPLYPLKVIEVQGLAESSLGEAVRAAAQAEGVDVQTDREPEQNRFTRSDQYSFVRRGIPALAFKFGYEFGSPEERTRREWVRDVYHKPIDDVKQPVDTEAAVKFDRVILGLLERVADDPSRPKWNDDSFFKRFAVSANGG
ncbi:MAG TPA: M20/M25/M40 family metallo-hydrolase [Vicinamibacterales bacterium]|jgi:hypothetical protein|nr:M20/M25/M40 family metallo-hydrolase [Vicinamibacterales bacterium]